MCQNVALKLGVVLLLLSSSCQAELFQNDENSSSTNQIYQRAPPNLVVIMADDLGYGDVGFNGCKDIPTPHIDSIANNGVRFSRGYVSSSICGPSRAGFITGRYQDRFGFTSHPPTVPKKVGGVPPEERTIAEMLKSTGYRSAIIGKWHLGAHVTSYPLDRGFDYFYGFLKGKHGYKNGEIIENRTPIVVPKYLTDAFSDKAVEFINEQFSDEQEEQPFFLFLSYNAPHQPLQVPERYEKKGLRLKGKRRYRKKLRRALYSGMVRAMDDGVGRVLDAIEAAGATEDTIVVFLSDNGGPKHSGSDNGPFRGQKWTLYEGGLRVPFAMQWPGTIPKGMTYDEPISSLDIMATIMGINDISEDENLPLDGVNLIPYLTGEERGSPHDYLFWKLLLEQRRRTKESMAVQNNDKLKLLTLPRDTGNLAAEERYKLYDLRTDEKERRDVYDSVSNDTRHQEQLDMLNAWQNWNSELKACWWK